MSEMRILEAVLEASVARRGEVPLTNAHLLNIVRMTNRVHTQREDRRHQTMESALNQVLMDDAIWGRN